MGLASLLQSWFARRRADHADTHPTSDETPTNAVHDTAVADLDDAADELDIERWWTPKGEPVTSIVGPEGFQPLVDVRLYDKCVAMLDRPDIELPQIPTVAQQLLVRLHDESCDLRKAAGTASKDPAFTADVLRVVNSVAYRGVNEITSLEQAFVRLGRRGIRSLVLASSVKRVAIHAGGERRTLGEELWRRSVASSAVCGVIGGRIGLAEDVCFLLGLLHDIGMLVVLKIVHDYQQQSKTTVPRSVFDALCNNWHERLGLRLAEAWNLPDPLPAIVANHHHAPGAGDELRTEKSLVAFSDAVCALLEYSTYVPYDLFALPCTNALGLSDDHSMRETLLMLPDAIETRLGLL